MLTQDENIVDVNFAIQYQVKDAKDYLFNVRDPDLTLGQVTESAIREIIGKSKMDFVLTEGRSEVVQRGEKLIQDILDLYNSGLQVISLNMPEQVQAAFSDAVKAREDRQRSINEAEAYSNAVIPRARGERSRMIEESKAYKQQVIEKAQGETSRFQQVLDEYEKAPEVTRERLYLDTIEEVMNRTSKVMLNVKQGGNILFLPLDRLLQGTNMSLPIGTGQQSEDQQSKGSDQSRQQSNQGSRNTGTSNQSLSDRARTLLRSREIR
jgi:membrane protease subunit HflK